MTMSSPTHSDTEKPSASAIENGIHNPLHSRETENKLLRKMDLRLIPMLATLYLLAFLDRGNIGNAKIEGMLTDLHMTGQQYSLSRMFWPTIPDVMDQDANQHTVTVFFFTYVAFELPSNLLLKKLRPSRLLPLLMFAWGIVMVFMLHFLCRSLCITSY